MTRHPPAIITNILGDVFGLPGIIILALLLGMAMGLAVQPIDPPRITVAEAASPSDGSARGGSAGSENRFSAIPSIARAPLDRGFQSALLRVRTLACPLPVMAQDARCN